MSKVYVVFEYNYDDTKNHGVFATEELARRYISRYAAASPENFDVSNMDIQEWEVQVV